MTAWNNVFSRTARRRFWVFSDLQQHDPENARRCMHAGVEDFLSLGLPVDAACYLGDATEGAVLPHLEAMARMQIEELSRVDAPVFYVMGNHEFDYYRYSGVRGALTVPMRELVLRESQWRTTPSVRDPLLIADFGDVAVAMFSDHGSPDGSWIAVHGGARDASGPVPYPDPEAPARHLAEIAALGKPVFTMSHYAFPGGNRASDFLALHRPLPSNVAAHFYGHCHIGDFQWGGENCLRQISGIDGSALTQFDVASLENRRGNAVRSAILEWNGGSSYAVFFRNHTAGRWEKAFFSDA